MAGERILVVDDNAGNLKLAQIVLETEGFEVSIALDAEKAIAAVETFRPALILMDIQLPGMDGLELTRRLKGDPETSRIVIIALSAYAMKTDEMRALQAGCDGYISKPIDTRELPKSVARYLAAGSGTP